MGVNSGAPSVRPVVAPDDTDIAGRLDGLYGRGEEAGGGRLVPPVLRLVATLLPGQDGGGLGDLRPRPLFEQGPRHRGAPALRFALLVAILLHAGLLIGLRTLRLPPPAVGGQEIPVEIVVETATSGDPSPAVASQTLPVQAAAELPLPAEAPRPVSEPPTIIAPVVEAPPPDEAVPPAPDLSGASPTVAELPAVRPQASAIVPLSELPPTQTRPVAAEPSSVPPSGEAPQLVSGPPPAASAVEDLPSGIEPAPVDAPSVSPQVVAETPPVRPTAEAAPLVAELSGLGPPPAGLSPPTDMLAIVPQSERLSPNLKLPNAVETLDPPVPSQVAPVPEAKASALVADEPLPPTASDLQAIEAQAEAAKARAAAQRAAAEVKAKALQARRIAQAAAKAADMAKAAQAAKAAASASAAASAKAARDGARRAAAAAPGAAEAGDDSAAADAAGYGRAVVGRIAAMKRYPEAARERGPQGTAIVSFSVGASGEASGLSIARSSGDAMLDAEALATVRRASPFPPPPRAAPRRFSAPLAFRMR